MATTFDNVFVERASPGMLRQFGTEVEHWPGGDHTAVSNETWMIEHSHEQGENSGLADKMNLDRRGSTSNSYVELIGLPGIQVTDKDQFKFVHPTTKTEVVANAVRRIRAGAMQAWLCVITGGIDTKHARIRS